MRGPRRLEGNYLGKSRRNYHLSDKCVELLQACTVNEGLSQSAVIEQAVREYYASRRGKWESLRTGMESGTHR